MSIPIAIIAARASLGSRAVRANIHAKSASADKIDRPYSANMALLSISRPPAIARLASAAIPSGTAQSATPRNVLASNIRLGLTGKANSVSQTTLPTFRGDKTRGRQDRQQSYRNRADG